MKAKTIKQLKDELHYKSSVELVDICLTLSKFKKDNKELLSYLLFQAHDEAEYIANVKAHIDDLFEAINTKNYFYIRKSVRKILTITKKFIRYSKKVDTEVQLLLYICIKLKNFYPSISRSPRLTATYDRQLVLAKKAIAKLHEDLQFDYNEYIIDHSLDG